MSSSRVAGRRKRRAATSSSPSSSPSSSSLFSSIVSPLIVVDADGRILEMNKAAQDAFGQDFSGRAHQEVFRFVGRDPVSTCLKTGKAQHRVESFSESGRLWGLTISPHPFTPRRRGSGRYGAIIGCRDLTELRRMEQAVAAAEHEAIIGRLAATVAHEVNNPLGAMKAHLNLIRKALEPDHRALQGLDILSSQIDRIARTVRLLLGFSRQRSAATGSVDPAEAIRTVLALFEEAFQERGIALKVEMPDQLPNLMTGVDQLQEILVNLMENARDILKSGSHLTVSVSARPDRVEFTVEDDGPGLGADPEKVFEPFFTTKTTGTGLGLTIARRICESLGGALTADNVLPHGARFLVTLPTATAR